MKVFGIQFDEQSKSIGFEGKRVNKNLVKQLSQNNPYSLNDINSRAIDTAITELGNVSGLKNIKFLMDTAAKSKYSTNIELKDRPKNNWRQKLVAAALTALSITTLTGIDVANFAEKIKSAGEKKNLNNAEKEILKLRKKLLKSVDIEQIQRETTGGIKDFEHNLDYFIISSETTLEHKKYVLERLNYMLSDEYEINPQLKDKKSVAVAEMVNDMAIATPGHKIPNIKAINQKHHGICAIISIVRKKLAYEDKPNYVDSILSELDSSNFIKVYDRTKLGTGAKEEVVKIPVDFEDALNKGYRIIDASTMHWMQISKMNGYSNFYYQQYYPFDKENFDVKCDSFFNVPFNNEELVTVQNYYQALLKAKMTIEDYKAGLIKSKEEQSEINLKKDKNIQLMSAVKSKINLKMKSILPEADIQTLGRISGGILSLEKDYSIKIKNSDFEYVRNENDIVKKRKISSFIKNETGVKNIDDKTADEILEFVNYYHELAKEINPKKTKSSRISKAENLYSIGAAYRYQFLMSLEESSTLDNMVHKIGLTNRESRVCDTVNLYLEKLQNNSGDSEIIEKHFADLMGEKDVSRQDVIGFLEIIQKTMTQDVPASLDNLYCAMTLESRKGMLLTYIDNMKTLFETSGNDGIKNNIAMRLRVENNSKKVHEALNNLKQELENGNDEDYERIFDIIGNYSQINFLKIVYSDFINKMSADDNQEIFKKFIEVHNIPLSEDNTEVMQVINKIEQYINNLDMAVNSYAEMLRITDDNGNVLFSPEPKDAIVKLYEDRGVLIPRKTLVELKTHFDNILKDQSSDEFNSRQGKLKDQSLSKFTKNEEEALKTVQANLNYYYSSVKESLTNVQSDMKENLETLNRVIGVNEGHWWVGNEGKSGAGRANQIRILEYMTGRPYHEISDYKEAVEKIKTSPYSGITSSSVYHNNDGWHAQYVADIAPVKVKVKDKNGKIKEEIREVLFQDNTWGASEYENIWVDENGLMRTDYSDNRGGTLGYITNDKMQNGNFLDRITGDMVKFDEPDTVKSHLYKKIKRPGKDSFISPQYRDIIIQGTSDDDLYNLALQIKDDLFCSTKLIKNIDEQSKGLTSDEIKSKIRHIDYIENMFKAEYEVRKSRIFYPFGPESEIKVRFMSEEEYDSLADNDPLKVSMERIALLDNYYMSGKYDSISLIKDIKDLRPYRIAQTKIAQEDFKYSFAKNMSIIDYLATSFPEEANDTVCDILKKYGISKTEEEIVDLIPNITIDYEQFDGSLKNTISKVMIDIRKSLSSKIDNKDAVKEISQYIYDIVKENMYFNEKDIDNPEIEHIIRFIDRLYDPQDNEELVKIYRRIQDMTIPEFKSEILSKAKPEDLGIKSETGYDVLRKIQRYEEKANRSLLNDVWREQYYRVMQPKKVTKDYHFYKLNRKPKGLSKYDFETAYQEINYDLSMLNYEKLFNKYKDDALKNYNAYPAYPEVSEHFLSDKLFNTTWETSIKEIEDKVTQINFTKALFNMYDNADNLFKNNEKYGDEDIISGETYESICQKLGYIITTIYGEEPLQEAFDIANELIELPEGTKYGEYRTKITKLHDLVQNYKNNFPSDSIDALVEVNSQFINGIKQKFVDTLIQKRYRNKVMSYINDYEHCLITGSPKTEEAKNTLWNAYVECHILREPKALIENYIETLGTDSKKKDFHEDTKTLLTRALDYAKVLNAQTILMDALEQGIETDVKAAFSKVTMELTNGDLVELGSKDIINHIVYSLVLDKHLDTAIMFLEKLGLNEQFVSDSSKIIKYDEMKKLMDKAVKLFDNFSAFDKEYNKILNESCESLENGESADTVLTKMQTQLAKAGRKYKVTPKGMNTFVHSLEDLKTYFAENPNANPAIIVKTMVPDYYSKVAKIEAAKYNEINGTLGNLEIVVDLINKITLNVDSQAFKDREEMNKKVVELTKYNKMINKEDYSDGETDLPENE